MDFTKVIIESDQVEEKITSDKKASALMQDIPNAELISSSLIIEDNGTKK